MEARLLFVVLTLIIFVSLPPVSSGPPLGLALKIFGRGGNNFVKGFRSGMKWYHRADKAQDTLGNLGSGSNDPGSSTQDDAPSTLQDMYGRMFTIQFSVGKVEFEPQNVIALLGISSEMTWINSQQVFNKNIFQCCSLTENGADFCCEQNCGAKCEWNNRGYALVTGDFFFGSNYYYQSPFEIASDSTISIGIISFSKSQYSILESLQTHQFSYFFSYNSNKDSSVVLGDSDTIPRNELHSTKLLSSRTFPNLYFVGMTQILVGSDSVHIVPETDLANGVILDTIVPAILLAESAYKKVRIIIVDQMGQPEVNPGSNDLQLCYGNSPSWPDLTLSFTPSSGYASKMVLRKENYVVMDDSTKLECAAILPTSDDGFSVIGTMAQLDRQMIFDNNILYFAQYPDVDYTPSQLSPSASDSTPRDAKPNIVLNLIAVFSSLTAVLAILCA